MILAPGRFARLLFGDWQVVVADNGEMVVRTEKGEMRLSPLMLRDIAVFGFVFWARIIVITEYGDSITLIGAPPEKAKALRAQIRRHYTAAAVADMQNIGAAEDALTLFYNQPRYLSADDADKWLAANPQIQKSLAQMRYYRDRPLFDDAITNLPAVISRFADIDDAASRKELHERNGEFAKRKMNECAAVVRDALESFYALPRYLSANDTDKWLGTNPSIRESLARGHYYLSRHLSDGAMTDFPAVISRFDDIDDAASRKELRRRNKTFAEGQMRACAEFFDSVEKTPLTIEQRYAAVVMEDRNLLIAAAGSGKTSALVGKVGYALHRGICRPQEIAAIAFNKKAAEELRERINARLANLGGGDVIVETFHAMGRRIIGEATGKKPSVADWAVSFGDNINDQTENMIKELAAADSRFCSLFGELYSLFRRAIKPRSAFKSEAQYKRHLETLGVNRDGEERFPTIKGDMVKSMEECAIANFLHCKGVRYEYERYYEHDVADAKHGQYRPDFYYPDAGLYHEHFALNEKGEAPAFMGGAEYVRDAEWKKNKHKEKGTNLFITTSGQFHGGDFFADLRRGLEARGVVFGDAMAPETIRNWLQSQESRPLYELMARFLSMWKACGKGIGELYAKAEQLAGYARARAMAFLGAMNLLRDYYERKLRDNNEVDFEDMLAIAADKAESGDYVNPYQLILVDEFQDISFSRARLIKAMLGQRWECKLFAVGDDWQAIYRFAGADIGIMRGFAAEFGTTEQSMLTKTFRSNQGITDIAAAFVGENPEQIKKEVRAADSSRTGVVGILHYWRNEEVAPVIQSKLEDIAARNPGAKVFILGRYQLKHYQYEITDSQLAEWKRRFRGKLSIAFLTMHKAKGLEADYVFIAGMNGDKYGFPNRKKDDALLSLVMPEEESFDFAEERRLFYVALTRAKRQSYLLARMDDPSPFVKEINNRHQGGEITNETAAGGKTAKARLCPQCRNNDETPTGFLLLRTGRYGTFYGCSNYPKTGCRYKEKRR